MDKKRKILLRYGMAGSFVGYCIFHPLIMLFSYLMVTSSATPIMTTTIGAWHVIERSFSLAMLPWSLSFAIFNGIIGLYYGSMKFEKLEREELIVDLQKALADVKTLSGMLPICAWCKKIRSDEGYWQNIEAYMKSHLDLDFTHAICSDCAKKEYPELCQDLENISIADMPRNFSERKKQDHLAGDDPPKRTA
jgi:hypothetical protein